MLNYERSELKQWHTITLDFASSESYSEADPTTFLDHRLDVTFTHKEDGKDTVITVPGFFAADGDSKDSGAESGKVWRVHFTPPETGTWTWEVSFRTGNDAAIRGDGDAGKAIDFDGDEGSFTVGASNKGGDDFRGKGTLVHEPGDRYLTFAGTGEAFLAGGPGSPENFLAYSEFDGTVDLVGKFLHDYAQHGGDANGGDPLWSGENGNGSEILGALNYLAEQGQTSIYLLLNSYKGDGDDVWPWATPSKPLTYDVSKLDQWGVVFEHAQSLGIHLHLFTQEQENDQYLDNGGLGTERKLYYRELVARYGHLNGITWNLGEENTNSRSQREDFANYIADLDAYDHPIAVHTFPGEKDEVFNGLLGFNDFDIASLQSGDGHGDTLKWLAKSEKAGSPWVVTYDEFGGAQFGVRPDSVDGDHDEIRSEYLWGNLMAGGGGVQYYVGYSNKQNDLTLEDFRIMQNLWEQTDHALNFFKKYLPFDEMVSLDELLPQNARKSAFTVEDYVFADEGQTYAIYIKDGGTTDLDLDDASGTFEVLWYDPRNGGGLKEGSVETVQGGDVVDLGEAPGSKGEDWVALVRKIGAGGPGPDPEPEPEPEPEGRISLAVDKSLNGNKTMSWDAGVTIRAVDADGGTGVLKVLQGAGVSAGDDDDGGTDHEIDYDGGGQQEKLVIDFGRPVEDVTFTVLELNPKVGGDQESGVWRALDDDGDLVATGIFGPWNGSFTGTSQSYKFAIDETFEVLELAAGPFRDPDDDSTRGASDFALAGVAFTSLSTYDFN